MQHDYDLVIIGGGMVGASFACALLPAARLLGMRIAIIEQQPMPSAGELNYQPSYDARATALSYGSRIIYERLGIWETLKQQLTAIRQIHVSDRGHFGATRLDATTEKVPALGYVVENHWLGRVLLDRLQREGSPEIHWICPAEVTALSFDAEGANLTLKQQDVQKQYRTGLVVMADGGRSALRESLGIRYSKDSYHQHALVANVSVDRDHLGVAWERFTDQGPMALLPLSPQDGRFRCGLVWTVPEEQLESLLAMEPDAFLAHLQERFGNRAGRFIRVGERYHYPLSLSRADEQVRSHLVVLGNAAHALHPIAGQGYNLALRGATALAEQLIKAWQQGQPLGDLSGLQEFYASQQYDQQRTIGFSDRSMKLFSNANPVLAVGRNLGLQFLDICPPAKTLFARAAMGIDLPAPDLQVNPSRVMGSTPSSVERG